VVFASNTTSAAVDAFCAGVPVVQMMDGRTFNMSPLRGQPGVVYVESPEALADALSRAKALEGPQPELFNLDPNLPRWRRLLVVEGASSG
jgi:surface carbohydrate biosynthesis protein (TIGR04326 family)